MATARPAADHLRDSNAAVDALAPATRGTHAVKGVSRFSRILAAVDGSRASGWVTDWCAALAAADGANVAVLGVAPPPTLKGGQPGWAGATELSGAREDAQAAIDAAVDTLRASRLAPTPILEHGAPADAIVRIGADADLIVMGASGRTNLERMLLGSVTTAVKDRCASSLLVCRNGPPPRSIVAATDGSSVSRLAVAHATRLAEAWRSNLSVVHAVQPGREPDAAARKAMAILTEGIRRRPGPTYDVILGPAADTILANVQRRKADLVVLGSRGLGRVRGALLGSVSARLLRHAPCSILVVK